MLDTRLMSLFFSCFVPFSVYSASRAVNPIESQMIFCTKLWDVHYMLWLLENSRVHLGVRTRETTYYLLLITISWNLSITEVSVIHRQTVALFKTVSTVFFWNGFSLRLYSIGKWREKDSKKIIFLKRNHKQRNEEKCPLKIAIFYLFDKVSRLAGCCAFSGT